MRSSAQYGVDAIALRFTHVYGPGRTTQCFVREMLASAAEQTAVPHSAGERVASSVRSHHRRDRIDRRLRCR